MSAQIFPIVGAAPLVLPDPLPTQDVSDGTPGAATPATAIQVAGTDGINLRVLGLNSNGQLNVSDATVATLLTTIQTNTTLLLKAVDTLGRILARLEADARMMGTISGFYENTDENFADYAQ